MPPIPSPAPMPQQPYNAIPTPNTYKCSFLFSKPNCGLPPRIAIILLLSIALCILQNLAIILSAFLFSRYWERRYLEAAEKQDRLSSWDDYEEITGLSLPGLEKNLGEEWDSEEDAGMLGAQKG